MKLLAGISIEKLPYKQLKLVGVLLFSEYPSTIVYKDESNTPVIKEWVDCSDDNKLDRYFYYSVDRRYLKQFIDREISHADLINNSSESYVYFQDERNETISNTILVSVKAIPNSYFPSSDFLFHSDDGVDTDSVVASFELRTNPPPPSTIQPITIALPSKQNYPLS